MRFVHKRRIEASLFLLICGIVVTYVASVMGTKNLLSTMMATAHDLLLNTVFYIMAICVLAGAFGKVLIEFGVVRLLEAVVSPFMKPIFNLPGVASLGGLMSFFSDNPAIISLAKDKNYCAYFKKFQLISLTNFGTTFGMGLVVITFMISKGYFSAGIVGLFGAIIGGAISTRLMQRFILKKDPSLNEQAGDGTGDEDQISFKTEGNFFLRLLNSVLDGGKTGVEIGLAIIPGVLIICTVIMIITFQPANGVYTGAAYEGVAILPYLGGYLDFIFKPLFGFNSPELIVFPITSLGAVGAALSLVPKFAQLGILTGNDIAVFTAMGMCWSGFLSTHTAMLDVLGYRNLTGKAIIAHTIGGACAGISAHFIYMIIIALGWAS